MTEGAVLKVYDHKFNLMWKNELIRDLPSHADIREVDLIISNYTIR